MLTDLKMSSFACKYVVNFTDHNMKYKGGTRWNRAQRFGEKNGVIV